MALEDTRLTPLQHAAQALEGIDARDGGTAAEYGARVAVVAYLDAVIADTATYDFGQTHVATHLRSELGADDAER